jgi:hypothetical protein
MFNVRIFEGIFSDGNSIKNVILPCAAEPREFKGSTYGAQFVGTFNTSGIAGMPNRINTRIYFKKFSDFEIMDGVVGDDNGGFYDSKSTNFEFVENESNFEVLPQKTDEEIQEELKEKFFILDLISQGVASNQIRSLVVTGSPGTGKSFGIEKVMRDKEKENASFFFTTLKGTVSAIKLYSQLWECREKNCVLIIDDCDIDDVECFNMLKAATDSSRKRVISYNKLATFLSENDIPHSFVFEGGLIYLSNINLAEELSRKSKISPHVAAFVSRAHYIDVTLKTKREQIIRVMMVAQSEGFAKEHNVTKKQIELVCQWVHENNDRVREISIRLITKLCDLVKTFDNDWQRIANVTLCR